MQHNPKWYTLYLLLLLWSRIASISLYIYDDVIRTYGDTPETTRQSRLIVKIATKIPSSHSYTASICFPLLLSYPPQPPLSSLCRSYCPVSLYCRFWFINFFVNTTRVIEFLRQKIYSLLLYNFIKINIFHFATKSTFYFFYTLI